MTEADMIQHLYDTINNQNDVYMWIIGIMFTAFLAIIGLIQWRISDKQIAKMHSETKSAQKSAETLLKISIDTMMADNKVGAFNWHQKASFYIDFKNIVDEHYPKNKEFKHKLKLAKQAVLASSLTCFSKMIEKNVEFDSIKISNLLSELGKLYDKKGQLAFSYDREKLKDFSQNISNENVQKSWENEVEKLNTFWDKETLEDD